MRVEAGEHEVRLRPETEWEREQLMRIQQSGVESVRWTDEWERRGDLVLGLRRHPWDKER